MAAGTIVMFLPLHDGEESRWVWHLPPGSLDFQRICVLGANLANVRDMARGHRRGRRRTGQETPPEDRRVILRRRATRLLREGRSRKASVALQELVAMTQAPADYVALGHSLLGARRHEEGIRALRQGMWLHSRSGNPGRARAVAKLILDQQPGDEVATRYARAA